MFRQEGDSQVRDRIWYQQDHTWVAEMIQRDTDTGGSDSRPPTLETIIGRGQWRGERNWTMILIYQQLHHQTPSESFRVKHPASHWQTCQKGEMAPGPAGIHVPRAPRNCNRQGVGGQSKPQAGGWCSFSGRKGTDRWRTGDGTSKTTPVSQK